MSDARQVHDALAEAQRLHRPAMSAADAWAWVFGWSLGFGALWYFSLGMVVGMRGGAARVGPVVIALVVAAHLLLPGVGVIRPGGARAPVILRSAPAVASAWFALNLGLWTLTPGFFTYREETSVAAVLTLLGMLGTPALGVALSYLALVGRGPVRSALLTATAALAAGFALVAPIWFALSHRDAAAPMSLAFEVGAGLAFMALVALARRRRRLGAMDPTRWSEGHADASTLRLGDDVYAKPEALARYVGPVCAFSPWVSAGAPGRGGRPLDPRGVLPCTRAQLPMLLTDARDASSSLALLLATAAAISAALGL